MRPAEACEPLFRYICQLNRSARAGAAPDRQRVRADVIALLDGVADRARADAALRPQFDDNGGKLLQVLVYFVDFMIIDSQLPFAMEWEPLEQTRYEEAVGDERFWICLDEALADRSKEATDRLEVFYICIGLGFTGLYAGQPEYLRGKMADLARRLESLERKRVGGRICPEAYEHTDDSNLYEPPTSRLKLWGLVTAGMIVVAFVTILAMFNTAKSDLEGALDDIVETAAGAPADGSGGA